MTYKELLEEVKARGFEHISEARLKRWINQAYREIVDHRAWEFLEEEKEGNAPLEFEDLGHVLSVVNVTEQTHLGFTTVASLGRWDPALSSSGTATQWYMKGSQEIHVFPTDAASTIKVTYLKVPADLKEDEDEPVIPVAYHGLIVDGAVLRAYKNTDNFEAASAVRQELNIGLRGMVKTLRKSYDGNRLIQRTGSANDYLG